MYDKGLLKVSRSSVPTICIGNITVGGTGKTPHTEMLLRLLRSSTKWNKKHLAVLSRGYMRKSSGFLEVTEDGSSKQFGDEPLQIKKKFPAVTVAVDSDRVRGCQILSGDLESGLQKKAKLIILEDAFQYRSLKADANVVLVDYNRPIFEDSLLPVGRLRDLPSRLSRADIVIVSKCPAYLKREEADVFTERLGFKGDIFYTTMYYDDYVPVFREGEMRYVHAKRVILFSGIANDEKLFGYLSLKFRVVKRYQFGDHHRYVQTDIAMIRRAAEFYATAIIMTTEKDAQRILDCDYVPKIIRERLFYVPMYADFIYPEDSDRFNSVLSGLLDREKGGDVE